MRCLKILKRLQVLHAIYLASHITKQYATACRLPVTSAVECSAVHWGRGAGGCLMSGHSVKYMCTDAEEMLNLICPTDSDYR